MKASVPAGVEGSACGDGYNCPDFEGSDNKGGCKGGMMPGVCHAKPPRQNAVFAERVGVPGYSVVLGKEAGKRRGNHEDVDDAWDDTANVGSGEVAEHGGNCAAGPGLSHPLRSQGGQHCPSRDEVKQPD